MTPIKNLEIDIFNTKNYNKKNFFLIRSFCRCAAHCMTFRSRMTVERKMNSNITGLLLSIATFVAIRIQFNTFFSLNFCWSYWHMVLIVLRVCESIVRCMHHVLSGGWVYGCCHLCVHEMTTRISWYAACVLGDKTTATTIKLRRIQWKVNVCKYWNTNLLIFLVMSRTMCRFCLHLMFTLC